MRSAHVAAWGAFMFAAFILLSAWRTAAEPSVEIESSECPVLADPARAKVLRAHWAEEDAQRRKWLDGRAPSPTQWAVTRRGRLELCNEAEQLSAEDLEAALGRARETSGKIGEALKESEETHRKVDEEFERFRKALDSVQKKHPNPE